MGTGGLLFFKRLLLLGLLVLKAEWIPLAIVLWVVWNVRRLLRSAKAASSAKSGG